MDSGNGNKKVGPNGELEVGSTTMGAVKGRRNVRIQPTRSSARLRKQWLPFEVLDNELLRKKILEYAIFSGGDKRETRNNACSLRLVGKSWNETIIKLLHKHQEPLFEVSNRSCRGYLKRFCSTFSSSTPVNGSIVPFSLDVVCFKVKILTDMYNLFARCVSGLVQLTIHVNTQGKPNKSQLQLWSLPRLAKLEVSIEFDQESASGLGETAASVLTGALGQAATGNVDFNMILSFEGLLATGAGVQSMLETITIPASITKLKLTRELRNADIQVLALNPLPNLNSLTLFLKGHLLSNGSFFRILDIYRTSLRNLYIHDYNYELGRPVIIRFPVMEKLEDVYISSENFYLEPGLASLERSLPKLQYLRLQNQNDVMFGKWTRGSTFTSVTAVNLSSNNMKNLNLETIQSINFAFPNVQKLELSFSTVDASGLNYLFQEMTQLTDLKLFNWVSEPDVNSDFWDAVLAGVSMETVAESREEEDPGFWERFDNNGEDALGSIKNLRELTSLTLHGWLCTRSGKVLPLISDVTFKRALLKMPKLKKLYLNGSFMASTEMAEEWRNGGRLLECQYMRDSF